MAKTLSKKDKQGLLMIGIGVAAMLALVGAKILVGDKPKPAPDNCVGSVTANTVVILDHSDRLSDQTLEEIMARSMRHILDEVQINERVSVFTISDITRQSLKPIVSVCRPREDGNRAVENVQMLRKRFQQNFEKPIREALQILPVAGRESPIAQAITDLSLSQYLRGERNTLLIYSDMLEHTERFSLLRCGGAADVVSRFRASRQGSQERPEFKNTKVVLNLVPRNDQPLQNLKCRDQLWPWFFGNNSGSRAELTLDYLPGGTLTSSTSGIRQ
ncbi:hypothetical protein [Azoarcus sp. CIB]|uniref:hypothetical protein n=1 Tax=Aromatoleum sp. (strain CIB) TaxID=198107 RepID=UPI0012EEA2B1|nr:hypothetical protein [Azoarcus sp. CIB]